VHTHTHTHRKYWINWLPFIYPGQIHIKKLLSLSHANKTWTPRCGVTYMCVMILCRKTPSTSSMNMFTCSPEPASSQEPRGPSVRTYTHRNKLLHHTSFQCFPFDLKCLMTLYQILSFQIITIAVTFGWGSCNKCIQPRRNKHKEARILQGHQLQIGQAFLSAIQKRKVFLGEF